MDENGTECLTPASFCLILSLVVKLNQIKIEKHILCYFYKEQSDVVRVNEDLCSQNLTWFTSCGTLRMDYT